MKSRFTTVDLIASLSELQKLVGMRINQVYDIDNKTYLFKLARQEEKAVLLIESGLRIHTTEFEWPKNPAPSGFTMKLRKHLKNKRLENIKQLGIDRMIDMQFGINDAAYHVILELYDRGNIVLTDAVYVIQNILRPRATGSEDVKFLVREIYPVDLAKKYDLNADFTKEDLIVMFTEAKPNDNLKKLLNPKLICGPAILDHVFIEAGLKLNSQVDKEFIFERDWEKLLQALNSANKMLIRASNETCKGYIILKVVKHILPGDSVAKETKTFEEFHPFLLHQHEASEILEYESFSKATDIFFSSVEGQKIDVKYMQKEKEAIKKLDNFKKDHEKRVEALQQSQLSDIRRAQLIEMNLPLVEKAILVIRSAIANQISWSDIWNLIKEAQAMGDVVAQSIKALKLEINHFTVMLQDPYQDKNSEDGKPQLIDIDLDLTAYANARKFYNQKRHAAKKQQKTIESSAQAYKNAEKKTKKTLKEVAVVQSIIKARKTFWFEKFLWFISSENYIVIAGRDIQQNELIVKRYLKAGDIYVHADIHGASSVVVKNPTGAPIPPKTQNEAGTMAVCCSAAWDAKIVTSAWWVYHNQVSKTAPSGEYLTTGSFMIRGKKNYLPPSHLIMGFGFMFKLDEDSFERHVGERRVHAEEDESLSEIGVQEDNTEANDVEIALDESDDDETVKNDEIVAGETDKNEEPELPEAIKENMGFPDTVVKIERSRWSESVESDNETEVVYLGDDKPVVCNPPVTKNTKTKITKTQVEPQLEKTEDSGKSTASKRGQKFKMKKIKEKYKDQDDEERKLRMDILASAGSTKEVKVKKGKKSKDVQVVKVTGKPTNMQAKKVPIKPLMPEIILDESAVISNVEESVTSPIEPAVSQQETVEASTAVTAQSDDEQDPNEESTQLSEDIKILNSLTGCPTIEDSLIFCVPMSAPYAALQNFKYKVKVTPGTGKKGKAGKTAVNTFLKDKTATNREKDLLKSVKDQDIARNIPGKVKLSAPNLVKLKK